MHKKDLTSHFGTLWLTMYNKTYLQRLILAIFPTGKKVLSAAGASKFLNKEVITDKGVTLKKKSTTFRTDLFQGKIINITNRDW